MKKMYRTLLFTMLIPFTQVVHAQAPKRILIDIAHGQKFWNDPNNMIGQDSARIERIKYMTAEIRNTAESVKGKIGYVKGKIDKDQLKDSDVLFIHMPSVKYDRAEVEAIKSYLENGGSLFVVLDSDYWTTLQQTNVNDMITPFGISFGNENPDKQSGGYTRAGLITKEKLKITYHDGRIVNGGTPFCFQDGAEQRPFGAFAQLKNGGKIVAMGDGMVSLYMTSWNNVNDYQCAPFMRDVFAWLLK